MLQKVDCEQLKQVVVAWMAAEDPVALELLHLDGKVVKNAEPAPARSAAVDQGDPAIA
jgi:hypothetical protein